MPTLKAGLSLAVGLLAVAAARAGATGIARVNQDYRNASKPSFVLDKAPQLSIGPSRVSGALRPPNRDPRSNPLQVFQGNSPSRVFGGPDNPFRDAVVMVCAKAGLRACQPSQLLFRPLASQPLELAAEGEMSLPDRFHVRPGVGLSVAGGGK